MQHVDFFFSESFELLDFTVGIGANKLFNTHEAAANSDDEFPIHNFRVNFLCSKHIETTAKSCDWEV